MNTKRKSHQNCCVVNCPNTYNNTDGSVIFYSFPNRHKYELDQKNMWIDAVKRLNDNNTKWIPTAYSRICSKHFIQNKMSKDPRSPSFIPSIFPKQYKKKEFNEENQTNRYKRLLKKQEKIKPKLCTHPEIEIACEDDLDSQFCSKSIGFQVSLDDKLTSNNFLFYCTFEGDNVGTMAKVPSQNFINKTEVAHKLCGPSSSDLDIHGFHGFSSISHNEEGLKYLTGLSFKLFNFFSNLLPCSTGNQMSKENRILLFMMKIKLGLSYSVISVFFKIHRTTVHRIFVETLSIIHEKTKNIIFWPSKEAISSTLPECFKSNYPNCRCIIDCTEIRVEQLKTVEQRVYLYSNYKGCYTIKFLVAITPNGMVCFVSKCYGGRASDSYITNNSGFLPKLEPGDIVLADKGFPGIKTNCENVGGILVMPPMLHNGRFTEEEVMATYNIGSVRIHIERLFAQIKTFGIFNKFQMELLPYADKIFNVCCVISNLQNPIIKQ